MRPRRVESGTVRRRTQWPHSGQTGWGRLNRRYSQCSQRMHGFYSIESRGGIGGDVQSGVDAWVSPSGHKRNVGKAFSTLRTDSRSDEPGQVVPTVRADLQAANPLLDAVLPPEPQCHCDNTDGGARRQYEAAPFGDGVMLRTCQYRNAQGQPPKGHASISAPYERRFTLRSDSPSHGGFRPLRICRTCGSGSTI